MLTLVLDTSNRYLGIGLYDGDTLLDSTLENESKRQSEYAIPRLEALLKRNNVELRNIDTMVITIGPGSYTGVRVALTIAKTLAVVSDVKIKTVSSLAAYVGTKSGVSIIDARSHKLFVGVYEDGHPLMKETIMTLEEFTELRSQYDDFDVVGETDVIGLEETGNDDLIDNIFALAKDKEPVENVDMLVPTYIKEVEAKKVCY